MMGSLKALQEWCRIQCEGYNDVKVTNMSTSFRDGLAFCAIIHKHRPDLIDFDSLSKENIYENNRLAFEVAEGELGIPALLDPDDMVSMKVPDRLSMITYVSQYYNFFTNKSQYNPPCLKRPGGSSHVEPAMKKPAVPIEDKTSPEPRGDVEPKRGTISSTCAACGRHVHLVQRFLVDGKLYHRNCFRCRECSSTLLPGSYKLLGDSGSLVCTHHFARRPSVNQNGRVNPRDLALSDTSPETPPDVGKAVETLPDYISGEPVAKSEMNCVEGESEQKKEEEPEPPTSEPPNPFDESEEEEEEQELPASQISNGAPALVTEAAGEDRPIPAPRKASYPYVARPVPKPRPPRPSQSPAANDSIPRLKAGTASLAKDTVSPEAGDESECRVAPVPRTRSRSPASQSGDTTKPKDPPWLALVKQETKKKLAPPPPPIPQKPPIPGSTPAQKEAEPRPTTPPNPFDDDEEVEPEEASVPSSVVAVHPWYGISPAAEGNSSGKGSPANSESSGSSRSKKRPAPRAPKSSSAALPPSQSSSACPSPALSTESLSSSSSEHGLSRTTPSGPRPSLTEQEHPFTKSVSEPSINAPELKPRPSPSPSPSAPQSNTCSAPATPETNRSAVVRPPPPRPPATPSPLIHSPSSQSTNSPNKRVNPFNRKASPSVTSPQSRPSKGPRPARPPAPGHGFPLIKRKVQSDEFIPVEDIHIEMGALESHLDELEQRGVELEQRLRDCPNEEDEERLLVDWFTLIHEKHLLVRREAELVYTVKQQNLEERQADVEYELRCLFNKPEKDWSGDDREREKQLMGELVTIIEQRNQIINCMDQDRQREEEEDKLVAAMIKKKEFHGESEQKKKPAKFKPMKVLKRLSIKGDVRPETPRKEKS